MKFHVKKGDEVVVLAGKEKGKRGKIIAVTVEARAGNCGRPADESSAHTRKNPAEPAGGDCGARGDHPHFEFDEGGGI